MGISLPMKRPTIADVARQSGVSKTTVSVILNQSPASARVPPETHKRVQQIAVDLGYRPSWRARALTNRRTHMIGVLYAPPMPLIVRGNYEGIMAGINETLTKNGYHVIFVPLGEDPAGWGEIVTDQRLDGCLVLSRLHDALAALLTQSRMPVVLVNADTDKAFTAVLPDDAGGSEKVTQHLLDLGHRRITFYLGDVPPHYSVNKRADAYHAAMKRAGCESNIRVVREPVEQFVASIKDAAERPTAVITYTHYAAIKMLRYAWEAGLVVPDDISVATFSDSYPVAEVIPPLTAVALPTEEMGRTAAEMVLEQINNAGETNPRRIVLKETLIVRRSTAAPPGSRREE